MTHRSKNLQKASQRTSEALNPLILKHLDWSQEVFFVQQDSIRGGASPGPGSKAQARSRARQQLEAMLIHCIAWPAFFKARAKVFFYSHTLHLHQFAARRHG